MLRASLSSRNLASQFVSRLTSSNFRLFTNYQRNVTPCIQSVQLSPFSFFSQQTNDQDDKKKTSDKKSGDTNPNEPTSSTKIILQIIAGLGITYWTYKRFYPTPSFFWEDLKKEIIGGNIKHITIESNGHQVTVELKTPVGGSTEKMLIIPEERRFIEKLETFQDIAGINTLDKVPISHKESSFMITLLSTLAPYALLAALILRSRKSRTGNGSGILSVGQSRHKIAEQKNLNIRFKDVAGLDEAKIEIMEFVEFLKNPKKFQKLGAKIPKGAMLVGPPGTGKTLLAKAIAGEAGVPFFSISGSDFLEMFVGVGPARVRDLFKQARASSPCIIWIDEIDAVGRSRSTRKFGNDERENTLNQLLVEMDGFESSTSVIVLAGTNRVDILDKALLRPGRFDRQISIDAPDIVGRKDIFMVHLGPLKCDESKKEELAKKLAALTPAMTGADIANVCNEAALIAARYEKDQVDLEDFESAIERVIAGLERKSRILSVEERTRVAYHEAGHAIAGWFLKYASPLLKVSIVPRGIGTLGYAQVQPRDQNLYSTEQLHHFICTLLAGRAAEELVFNSISTGARDDLEKVTQIIYGQLVKYGMNSSIGSIAFPDSQNPFKSYGEKTARKIDHEAREMVLQAYNQTMELLREKRDLIEKVAQHLLKHEILRRDEMVALVGPRPHAEITTYEEMLGEGAKSTL